MVAVLASSLTLQIRFDLGTNIQLYTRNGIDVKRLKFDTDDTNIISRVEKLLMFMRKTQARGIHIFLHDADNALDNNSIRQHLLLKKAFLLVCY